MVLKPEAVIILNMRTSNRGSVDRSRHGLPPRRPAHLEVVDVSEDPSHVEKIKQEEDDEEILPVAVQHDLELTLDKYSREVNEEIRYIVMDLLKYPSIEKAQIHAAANRLGYNDLRNVKDKRYGTSKYFARNRKVQYCKESGMLVHQTEVPLCCGVWEFPKAGLSTYHYFETIKIMAGLVFIMGVFFSIASLYINIQDRTDPTYVVDLPRKVSWAPKILYHAQTPRLLDLCDIQAWLAVLVVVLWWFMIYATKCTQQPYERIVDEANITASDFTIMLEGLPGHYSQDKLQVELNRYYESLVYKHKVSNTMWENLEPFRISKMIKAIPFILGESDILDKELEGLDKDLEKKRELFVEWLQEFKENARFSCSKNYRLREYDNYDRMLQRRAEKVDEIEFRARDQYNRGRMEVDTIYFLTLNNSHAVSVIEDLNPQTVVGKIRYYLSCCQSALYFTFREEHTNQELNIRVTRAPLPEDIIWGNVGLPISIYACRKIIVALVILGVIGFTFLFTYCVTLMQQRWPKYAFLSFIFALVLTLMNMLMKFLVRILSPYERELTETQKQLGILRKCLIGMAINWTLCPLVLNLEVEDNRFAQNGLVYDLFYFAIVNAMLPPVIRLLDPVHFINKIIRWWKSRPYKKMIYRQSELNSLYEGEDFEFGWGTIYYMDVFFFTCFYLPMHPFVVLPAIGGYFFMYWAEKYCLLHRSKRPFTRTQWLTENVELLYFLGPFILAWGGFFWVCVTINYFNSLAMAAYMTLLFLSLLFLLTPFRSWFKCLWHQPEEENLFYDECRHMLPMEYDRVNPITAEKGIQDYVDYLKRKKEEDRATTLNRSEDNLMEQFDINRMIQDMTKIPSIFGKNTEITRKVDRPPLSRSRVRAKEDERGVRVLPQSRIQSKKEGRNEADESFVREINDLNGDEEDRRGVSYNSNGNAYGRKKKNDIRKTVNVLQGGEDRYEARYETKSHEKLGDR